MLISQFHYFLEHFYQFCQKKPCSLIDKLYLIAIQMCMKFIYKFNKFQKLILFLQIIYQFINAFHTLVHCFMFISDNLRIQSDRSLHQDQERMHNCIRPGVLSFLLHLTTDTTLQDFTLTFLKSSSSQHWSPCYILGP